MTVGGKFLLKSFGRNTVLFIIVFDCCLDCFFGKNRAVDFVGRQSVESFDDGMIALATTRGPLVIHGQGLRLQELSSGSGEVRVDGTVDSIAYEEDAPAGGFFARLFG